MHWHVPPPPPGGGAAGPRHLPGVRGACHHRLWQQQRADPIRLGGPGGAAPAHRRRREEVRARLAAPCALIAGWMAPQAPAPAAPAGPCVPSRAPPPLAANQPMRAHGMHARAAAAASHRSLPPRVYSCTSPCPCLQPVLQLPAPPGVRGPAQRALRHGEPRAGCAPLPLPLPRHRLVARCVPGAAHARATAARGRRGSTRSLGRHWPPIMLRTAPQ